MFGEKHIQEIIVFKSSKVLYFFNSHKIFFHVWNIYQPKHSCIS